MPPLTPEVRKRSGAQKSDIPRDRTARYPLLPRPRPPSSAENRNFNSVNNFVDLTPARASSCPAKLEELDSPRDALSGTAIFSCSSSAGSESGSRNLYDGIRYRRPRRGAEGLSQGEAPGARGIAQDLVPSPCPSWRTTWFHDAFAAGLLIRPDTRRTARRAVVYNQDQPSWALFASPPAARNFSFPPVPHGRPAASAGARVLVGTPSRAASRGITPN